jgi:hypothetical protein
MKSDASTFQGAFNFETMTLISSFFAVSAMRFKTRSYSS